VKELIQDDLTTNNLKTELGKLLYDEAHRNELMKNYRELWNILSLGGAASANAARIITTFAASK
jgi:lipid-A-disaccharide synthase